MWIEYSPGCCNSCGLDWLITPQSLQPGGIVSVSPGSEYGNYNLWPMYHGRTYAGSLFEITYGGFLFTMRYVAGEYVRRLYFGEEAIAEFPLATANAATTETVIRDHSILGTGPQDHIWWTDSGDLVVCLITWPTIYTPVPKYYLTQYNHADYPPGIMNATSQNIGVDALRVYPQTRLDNPLVTCYAPYSVSGAYGARAVSIVLNGFTGFGASGLNGTRNLHRQTTVGQVTPMDSPWVCEWTYSETVQLKTNGTDANGIRMVYLSDLYDMVKRDGEEMLEEMDVTITFHATLTVGSNVSLSVTSDSVTLGSQRTNEPYPNSTSTSTTCFCSRRNLERWLPMVSTGTISAGYIAELNTMEKPFSLSGTVVQGSGYNYYQNSVLLPGENQTLQNVSNEYYGYYDDEYINELTYDQSCPNNTTKTCTAIDLTQHPLRINQLGYAFANACTAGTPTARWSVY